MAIECKALGNRRSAPIAVVEDPQPRRQNERYGRKPQASGEAEKVVEDGDCGGNEEGDDCEADCACEPGCPVPECVGLEVD